MYHPRNSNRYRRCWTKSLSCRWGILLNDHHVAWGLAAAVAAVVRLPPAASPVGAAAVEEGLLRVLSPAGAAAAVAVAQGEIWGGRDGTRILWSWLSFSTAFANPSTPAQTFLSPTSSSFARPLPASMPLSPTFLLLH